MTTDALTFMLRFYRGPVFLDWLRRVSSRTTEHGHQLAEMLGGAGDMDSSASAEKWLRLALEEKLVRFNGPATPTKEQLFFGVGGLSGKHLKNSGSPLLHWFFMEDGGHALLELEAELRELLAQVGKRHG